jgi:hypothetical protein
MANSSINAIPDWFWVVFSRADFLDLRYNQISGTLPATSEFMAANTLLLSNNRFSGTIPKFSRNISYIDISSNSLSGTLPSDLEAPQLTGLLLYNNSISGTIPFLAVLIRKIASIRPICKHADWRSSKLPRRFLPIHALFGYSKPK